MGFWDFLSQPVKRVFTPKIEYVGGPGVEDWADALGVNVRSLSAAQMWQTQPHLRTVVSFLARNVAQLGVHVYERQGETDRVRDRSSAAAVMFSRPNATSTLYDLIFSLVSDHALYDRALWHVYENPTDGWTVNRIPPSWATAIPKDLFTVDEYLVMAADGAKEVRLPASEVLSFGGYNPTQPLGFSPAINSLRETLQEQIEAAKYRNQVWQRGGRVSSILKRPAGAPEWGDGARSQFKADWRSKFTGDGPEAGGTPILEDGMDLVRLDFTAAEQQFVEAAKLALSTVAAAFHVNPTMIGVLDNANYSNVREFRRMLYGDTLGPLLAQIEGRMNTFLLPMLGMDTSRYYVEFNIGEKLQGSFEEQSAVMQTMVGAPIMTRNEGRSRFNLPAVEGGDELITPLNVLEGGQASPTDSGSQNLDPKARRRARRKAARAATSEEI